jgi:enoyl-CoA hydratase/carnithine racemase
MTQPALPPSLATEQHGPVAVLRLRRPAKRNAMDNAMVTAIGGFFDALPPGTRAVVLDGDGDHFSAGLDLSTVTETDATAGIHHSRMWHRAFDRIANGEVPVIAVLHGAVVGGGLELACAAHIRVAEESAFYALPEGSRGIYVGGGASVRLPRLIGVHRMMDMMLTGRTYGAAEGLGLGFSQYVVPAGEGRAKAMALAARICENTPLTNFALIQALPRIADAAPETGLLMESLMAAIAQGDGEAKTRLRDFLEKRGPKVVHG